VFNRHAEAITGVTQQEAYDRPVAELFPGMDMPVTGASGVLTGETGFCDRLGNDLILAYSVIPFFDKEGARSGIIINFNDLTQIRQMEAELKRADRLAAVGELAARIAHEIRNPLASISGSVQLIAQGDGVPEGDRKLLSIVLRETDRLNRLVSDFLIYARPAPPHVDVIDLCDLYRELDALLKGDPAFQGISVRLECEEGTMVSADRGQMEQVLWNLFSNAADAMPAGGEILVSTRMVTITMRRSEQAAFVRIDVHDTGEGMTDEVTRNLFEPFFTTKPGGTGLGLATVYRIIDAHGGRIFVESAPGNGTTFSILLPAG
jgi:two-component system sensor histidine kinase PilS (NtrC family)